MKSFYLFLTDVEFLRLFQQQILPSNLISAFHEYCQSTIMSQQFSISEDLNHTNQYVNHSLLVNKTENKLSLIEQLKMELEDSNTQFSFFLIVDHFIKGYGRFHPSSLQFTFDFLFHPDEQIQQPISSLNKEKRFLLMTNESVEHLLNLCSKNMDSIGFWLSNFEHFMEEAIQKEKKVNKKNQKNQKIHTFTPFSFEPLEKENISPHYIAQHYIKKIGEIVEMDNWVAKNDKNRMVFNEKLGDGCLEFFPDFNLEDENFTNRFDLVDNIWFKNGIPYSFFEIEYSSSIISGILRICDIIATIPSSQPFLYIVAPRERKKDVFTELNRPTFKKIGISNFVYFLAIEDIEILFQKIQGLQGFIKPSIMQSIAQQI